MKIIKTTVIVICVLSILLLGGCTEKETKIYGKFNDTQNIVLYDNDISFVGDKDKALNLDELLIDSPGHVSTNEVHCVTAEKIYFSYSYYFDEKSNKRLLFHLIFIPLQKLKTKSYYEYKKTFTESDSVIRCHDAIIIDSGNGPKLG